MNRLCCTAAIAVALASGTGCGDAGDASSGGDGTTSGASAGGPGTTGGDTSGGTSGTQGAGTGGSKSTSNGATSGANGSGGDSASSTAGSVGSSSSGSTSGSGGGSSGDEPYEGFGATTIGGEGGQEVHVTEATNAAVSAAFQAASGGSVKVVFDVPGPIAITNELPLLTGDFVTIDGNGVTLEGSALGAKALVDVRGHDVIVRNIRLRNGGDNLRAQGAGAYNVVFSHVSSTGSYDDAISIGYGAHDVTAQYCFLAGNTRSIFIKYSGTTDISIHHSWIMKYWGRGPLVYDAFADLRNLIVEDWTNYGSRFEADASGNAVESVWRQSAYAVSIGGQADHTLSVASTPSQNVFADGDTYEDQAKPNASMNDPAAAPFAAPPVTTLPAAQMVGVVESSAGCMPRDAVDQAYIDATGWHVSGTQPFRDP